MMLTRLSCGALALSAALLAAPGVAGGALLANGNFEKPTIEVLRGSSGFPVVAPPGSTSTTTGLPDWAASAWNGIGGAVGAVCSGSGLLGASCPAGNTIAVIEDSLPPGALPTPAALYQTVTLAPAAYRFGGEFALAITALSLGDNESEAFLRIYQGAIVFDGTNPQNPPVGVTGPLLASINLSPSQFATIDFTLGTGSLVARPLALFEGVFEVTGTVPVDVTMQLVVLPERTTPAEPPRYINDFQAALIQATSLRIYADNLFIERTLLQPVPAPGALGVFVAALAGLAAVRRRKAS